MEKNSTNNQNVTKEKLRLIDEILCYKFNFGEVTVKTIDILFTLVIITIGIMARIHLFNIASGDYSSAFADWMSEIDAAGGWAYIGIDPVTSDASTFDYNCIFQYCLCLLYTIGGGKIADIVLVKMLSCIFDFVLVFNATRVTYVLTGSVRKSMMVMAGVTLLPTVIMNSAAWAQNDAIFTSFLMLSFYSFLKKRDFRTWLYVSIAFIFKQQTIFFLPFLILMWLKNKTKIRYILLMPVVYFVQVIPAWIAGRSLGSLLGIYSNQVGMFSRLSMNYPNLYTVITAEISQSMRKIVIPSATLITVMLMGILAYYIYEKKFEITNEFMISLIVFTSALIVFCLPVMHERYAYIPEVFGVIYAMYGYRKFSCFVGIETLAIVTYIRYLFGSNVTYLYPFAMINLCIILVMGYDLYKQINDNAVQVSE
ncbi:MAG: hypothetical protein IJV29_00755 [Butyrivibrio sp.]|nr:hypothetical protein [Butyrivibrio sp.]